MEEKRTGLVQVYTGEGKGKTTAAFGQALRAYGRDFKVNIIQFLKDGRSGEVIALRKIAPEIEVECFGSGVFLAPGGGREDDLRLAAEGLVRARSLLDAKAADLLVLDEICTAVSLGLLAEKQVLELMRGKPDAVELVLTGRNAGSRITAEADLVTRMTAEKHPFDAGRGAREGIEY